MINELKLATKPLITVLLLTLTATAQKLPNKQETSLRAPADIKIDGKADEWGDKFQAYDNANRIFYTIANDNDNLYIIIKATDLYSISKIGIGGIIFTISKYTDKKLREKADDKITVQFPVINLGRSPGFESRAWQYQDLKKDQVANKKQIDDLVETGNKRIADMFKDIKVSGIKTIDGPIPVNNTQGILAAGGFNSKFEYINELAIPLKYLNGIDLSKQFSYNIKLKGTPTAEELSKANMLAPPQIKNSNGTFDLDDQYKNAPTDFWGVYTLAKK